MRNYCKVLIIDDEFIMRQGIKHMLQWEKEGFTVIGDASNGVEALELIKELKPDIILCDIVMPVLDGLELTKLVQEKYPNIQIIILSSYDNFKYVKESFLNGAVDYILKPTLNPMDLLFTLKNAALKVPFLTLEKKESIDHNNLIESYILGFDNSLNKLNFNEVLPHTCFRIFGINIKQICGNDNILYKNIKEELKRFIETHKNYSVLETMINDEVLCCIINYKIADRKNIIEDIKNSFENLVAKHESLFFALSKEFDDILNIREIYNNSFIKLLKIKFYYKDTFLLVQDKEMKFDTYVEKLNFNEYSKKIKIKDINTAINMLKNHINNCLEQHLEEYELKNLTKNLIYSMMIALEDYGIDFDKFRYKFFKTIDNTMYVDEFKEGLKNIIDEIYKILDNMGNTEENKIKDILNYIKSHYQQHLDLREISEVFNFNYYYLSAYFNTYSKEGFSEYLNNLRIEKACELLKISDFSVAEVSSIVGYSEHSYFCRVFKRITGHTPSSYRKNNIIKGGLEF